VPGQGDVALLAGHRGSGVVPRPLGKLLLGGALEHDPLVVGAEAGDVQHGEGVPDLAHVLRG
jgi:hypothetical protein